MLRIREVKIPISLDNNEYIKKKISKLLNISKEEILDYKILKKSIDARDKNNILFIYEFALNIKNENKIKTSKNISEYMETEYVFNKEKDLKKRPIIVGSGPAGLFCAYMLASVGCNPIIIERGEKIEDRVKTVENFFKKNILNPESNIQFGEGGAGTFT